MTHAKLLGDVVRYEAGEMDCDEIVQFFQFLVDSGMAWTLQGSYGRQAARLIADGKITPPQSETYGKA